jgi:hypothetical protein
MDDLETISDSGEPPKARLKDAKKALNGRIWLADKKRHEGSIDAA